MRIRIKFTKQGMMKFIGHLDTMRYFQKAMRRAEVDICYSEGFSPHQIMSFAAPLGVGMTSLGEYLDIEVRSAAPQAEMVRRLNAVMADGFTVLSFQALPDKAKNAMSIVAAADYTITFRDGYAPERADLWFQELLAFLGQESIPYVATKVTKKGKKGETERDLKPLIYQYALRGDGIFLQLSAGSANHLKPQSVMEAFCQSRQEDYQALQFAWQYQREELYAASETTRAGQGSGIGGVESPRLETAANTERRLVALDQLGEDIE